jgi:hypothetical protein
MIEQTVQELTPIVGTRPAGRALGAAPATIYRRLQPRSAGLNAVADLDLQSAVALRTCVEHRPHELERTRGQSGRRCTFAHGSSRVLHENL